MSRRVPTSAVRTSHARRSVASVRALTRWCVAAAPVLVGLVDGTARGDASDVPSVFFVAKSENRNQVHYGVHLDASCVPAGATPVFVYWRMLEHGPGATEPLLSREVAAYGIADQHVVERRGDGGHLVMHLRAMPDRTIEIATALHEARCEVSATTRIDGAPAALTSVYAQLRWPFGVDYLLLSGRALADGHVLHERLAR